MKDARFLLLLLGLILLFYFPGCRKVKNPDGRLDVSGKITLNGKSFEGASRSTITFTPLDSPESETLTTTFNTKTGRYLLTRQDGLKPGKYRVRLYAIAQYDRKTNQPISPATLDDDVYQVVLIPKEFNVDSTIEFEVAANKKNVFDYDIKGELIFDDSAKKPARRR